METPEQILLPQRIQIFLVLLSLSITLMLSIWCCIMTLCRRLTRPPQDIEGWQPSNRPQQAIAQRAGQQPPLPERPEQILGTVVTIRRSETGETSDDCAICLEKFEDGELCRLFYNCKHMYHKFCIDQWLARVRHCPLCRGSPRGSASSHQL